MPRLAAQLALATLALLAPAPPASAQRRQARHFFGPPAVGFGVGILSVHRRFPVAASIVSRRASRSYSHQYHYQATPVGEHGYQTSRLGWIFCEAQARVRQGKARKGKERQGWRKVKGLKA